MTEHRIAAYFTLHDECHDSRVCAIAAVTRL